MLHGGPVRLRPIRATPCFNTLHARDDRKVLRVHTDIKMLFPRTFQDLQRPNSRFFQDSKILFQDFPGHVPFTNVGCIMHEAEKVHMQNLLSVYLHYSKETEMQ